MLIWNCAHSGWYPFGMVAIRDGGHSGWCPFGIVSIRDGVLRGCVFRDSAIRAIVRIPKNAYWQIDARAADRKYTAFSCRRGTFQFRKISMGTKNSAFTFQMAIFYTLKGTKFFSFAYIDDIVVFS